MSRTRALLLLPWLTVTLKWNKAVLTVVNDIMTLVYMFIGKMVIKESPYIQPL